MPHIPPVSNATKAFAGLVLAGLFGFGALVQSCIAGRVPTRSEVQAAEDRFCTAIAKIRATEKALDSGTSDGGSN